MKNKIIIIILLGCTSIGLGIIFFNQSTETDNVTAKYFCLKEARDIDNGTFKYDQDNEYTILVADVPKYYLSYKYMFNSIEDMNSFKIRDDLNPINEEYNEEELYVKLDFAEGVGKICKVFIDGKTVEVPDDPIKAIELLTQVGYRCEKQ